MERKSEHTKKAKPGKPHKPIRGKTGATLGTFQGAGGNLFGYLSQAYTGAEAKPGGGISTIYENQEAMAQIHAMDDQLKLSFKKVHKKDVATKTKGLTELKAKLEAKGPEELDGIAGYYVYIYSKIMATEYDRKIRELANLVLGVFIAKTKKSLGAYINKLLPFWYMAMCDPSHEVANLARTNYDACFPKDKQAKVLKLCYESFLSLVNEYLKTSKESIMEDLGSMADIDKEDVYERVISSILKAVSYLFSLVAADPELKQNYVSGIINILRLEEAESPLAKLLSGKYKSGIRAASLEVVVSLLENVKDSVIKVHEGKLSEFVLYSVGENNIRIQNVLWSQALIKFIKTCENCWAYINLRKAFLNKLYQCLRKAAFGAAPPLYQNFVVFLSLCPFLKLDPNAKVALPEDEKAPEPKDKKTKKKEEGPLTVADQLEIIKDIHKNLLDAVYNEETAMYAEKLFSSYFDCVLFVVWKRLLPFWTSTTDQKLKEMAVKTAIELAVKPLEIFEIGKSGPQLQQRIYEIASHSLAEFFNNIRDRDLPAEYVGQLEKSILEKLTEEIIQGKKTVVGEVHINLLHTLCTKIKPAKVKLMPLDDLGKLVLEFHNLLRKRIADDIAQLKTSAAPNVHPVLEKLHLYCLLTYKFLCVTDKPLLLPAYSEPTLPDYDWLVSALSSAYTDFGIVQYSLLSTSAVFGSTGTLYQKLFDTLLSLPFAPESAKALKHADGAKLLRKYAVNPITVTWELEAKFVHKKSKREKPTREKKKGELTGIVQLLNNSKVWPEVLKTTMTEMIDPKIGKENMDTYKGLYVGLIEYYRKNKLKMNIDHEYISGLIDNVNNEAQQCNTNEKFGLIEELIVSFVGEFMAPPQEEYEAKVGKALESLCKGLVSVLYNALAYYDQPISQSRLWTIVKKVLATGNGTYYTHYIIILQKIAQEFLRVRKEDYEITRFIQFIKAFLDAAHNKDRPEINILRDILFVDGTMTEKTCAGLFSDLVRLRIFTELFLRGGVGAAVPAMLMKKVDEDSYPYIGLTGEILKSLYLPCTSKTVTIRNQITLYTDVELIPFFVSPHTSSDTKATFILSVIKDLEAKSVTRGSLYPFALEHLLLQLIQADKENRTILPKSIYNELFLELVAPKLDQIILSQTIEDERAYSLVVHLLRCIDPILHKSDSYNTFLTKIKSKGTELSKGADQPIWEQLANLVGVYSAALNEAEASDMEFHKQILPQIIARIPLLSITHQRKTILYISKLLHHSIKIGIDHLLKSCGIEIKDVIAVVFQGLQACEKEHELVPELLLPICEIISLFAVFPVAFPGINMEQLVSRLIELSYLKCQEYKIRTEAVPVVVYELEYEMFETLGKLLERCVKFVTKNVSEELLYSLIGSNIESVQKAGYKMLKRVYVEFLPELVYPASEKWELGTIEAAGEDIEIEKSRYEGLNKNIPFVMIEMIEHVPSLSGTYHDVLKETKKSATTVESIIENVEEEGKEEEALMLYPETYGYLLCWNIILDKVYYGWLHSRKLKNEDYISVLNSISVYLNESRAVYEMFLVYLTAYLPTTNTFANSLKEEDIIGFDPAAISLHNTRDINKLALHCLFNFMKNYPSLARNFYSQCDPVIGKLIGNVVTKVVSPTIWFAEASNLHNCQDILKENQLEVTMMHTTREILASMVKDDVEFSISLKFPSNYPLKSIEVTNLKSGVFSEFEIKTWTLSMSKLISSQNCDILGALMLWKANYDKKFEGVEPCPICYSIVHEDTYSIPTLQCKTCKNKFHAACLKKWFRTSHKNKCPFCQNYFF